MSVSSHPIPNSLTGELLTASAAADLVRRREISARELVQSSLDTIANLDPALAAFCTLCQREALGNAAAVDERIRNDEAVGPLAGVPVAIKDLLLTAGMRTTFGSPLYADFIADRDDVAVERLRASGAIVIGKTNSSEFGYGAIASNRLFATTRNPWNPALTPGGSSAGSAAAVAAGMVPLALGSDGGGSIRVPAALTGIVGFKPSFGRVPVFPGCRDETMPGASGWETLEHIGPMARSIEDIALAMSALAGPAGRDRHSLPLELTDWMNLSPSGFQGQRAAFSADLGFATVDAEVALLAEHAARNVAHALNLPLEQAYPSAGNVQVTFDAIVAMDTDRAGLRRLAAQHKKGFGPILTGILDRQWTADEFTAALIDRKRIVNITSSFMQSYRLLMTPSVAAAAFPIDLDEPARIAGTDIACTSGWTPFSALANLVGLPAISVPAGFTSDGRPVGLQIIGGHLDDLGVLKAAAAYEQIAPWSSSYARLAAGRP